MRYQFAEFELDTERELLLGPGGPITLRPQPLRMLQYLIEAAPALVTRDALMDALWGHHALSINVIPQTLSELRQALGDDAQNPRFIETRHRRGYAFIATFVSLSPSPAAAPVEAADHEKSRPAEYLSPREPDRLPKPLTHPRRRWMIAAGILLAIGLAGTSALLMRSPEQAGNTTTAAPGTRPIVAITSAPERAVEAALLRLKLRAAEEVIVLNPSLVAALGESTNGPMQIRIRASGAWSLYASDNTLLQQGDAATGDFASRNNVLTTAVRAALQLSPRTGSESGWPSDSAALESLANASLALDRDEVERARAGFRLALTDLAAPISLRLLQASADRRAGDWTSATALLSNPASDTLGHSTPAHLLLDAQRADLSGASTEAMAALRAYHHLVPEDVGNTITLIDWQLHARQWQAAQTTLAELAQRAPWLVDVALRVPRARLVIGQEKPDDAMALLQPIFDTPDRFPAKTLVAAWQLRSVIEQNRGQSEQSLRALQPYIAIATPDLALLAGMIARERADIALAERAFATAISGFAVQGRQGQQRRAELESALESAQLDRERGVAAQGSQRTQTLLRAAGRAAEPSC